MLMRWRKKWIYKNIANLKIKLYNLYDFYVENVLAGAALASSAALEIGSQEDPVDPVGGPSVARGSPGPAGGPSVDDGTLGPVSSLFRHFQVIILRLVRGLYRGEFLEPFVFLDLTKLWWGLRWRWGHYRGRHLSPHQIFVKSRNTKVSRTPPYIIPVPVSVRDRHRAGR